MSKELLTTLAHVKLWLGDESTDNDDLLNLLIAGASRVLLNYLNRESLRYQTYVENYDGYGTQITILKQWPAYVINYIQFCGYDIRNAATGNPRTNGYYLSNPDQTGGPQRLQLFGYQFPRGKSLIDVSYEAGYKQSETHTVPNADPSTVTVGSVWLGDLGVVYEDTGAALTLVSSNPAEGEYSVATGVYTFNIADANKEVSITYSYVPDDVEQACYELVASQYKYKDRIGYKSKTLGGQETVAFDTDSFTEYTKQALNSYRRTVPL